MRKVIVSIFIFIALLFSFIIINCQKSRYEYFIVQVDSLYAPSPISHNDTLNIYLYGLIGTNGCYSFSHFEADRDSFKLNLTVWGKHDIGPVVCPDVIIPLDKIYQVFPLYPGLFFIEIEQPDGSVLKDTITVVIELTSQASGTVRYLPEMNILENAPVGTDIQSRYSKTTDLNREFRRGIFEFSVPESSGEILEANLILEESRAIISSPVPPVTHNLSYYTADLEVTPGDYNRSTTYFESFETDANNPKEEFIFDVTSLINEFEEANLGFRVELSIDTTFDEIKNFGSGFKAYPKIEVMIKEEQSPLFIDK